MRTITKKKFYFISSLVLALIIIIMLGVKLVNANEDNTESKYKYYTSYKIHENDTLTSIAKKYTADTNISISDYISELKNDNRLKDDEITEGESLIITYYSDVEK